METRKLRNSDLHVTPVGFGAWAIGGAGYEFAWGHQEDTDSVAAILRALELGVNFIDTAPVYGTGHSEEIVAKTLQQWKGKRPYIFTKCVLRWDENRKVRQDHSAASIRQECLESLRRLQTDVIDLYQMHWPPADNGRNSRRLGRPCATCRKKAKCAGSAFPISPRTNRSCSEIAPVTSESATLLDCAPKNRTGCATALLKKCHRRHQLRADGIRTTHWCDDQRARCCAAGR